MPSLGRAKNAARELLCKSRQRQLALAFFLFAEEHDAHLPGNRSDRGNTGDDAWMSDWLFGTVNDFDQTPYTGTLWSYVAEDRMYKCPQLRYIGKDAKVGSNGRFDFTAWEGFPGAKIANLPTETIYNSNEILPTPLITEEEPSKFINATYKDGGHGNWDKTGHWHRGGANHATVDGSTLWFQEIWDTDARSWMAQAPSGDMANVGKIDAEFGWWNEQ